MSTARQVLRWKERRALLPVWLSIGALSLFALFVLAISKDAGPDYVHVVNYLTVFWLGSCMIGLATGIMLFVPEREQETDLMLGRLPVESKVVSQVKLTEALLVFLIFVAVSLGLVVGAFWLRRGQFLLESDQWESFAVMAFIPVQTFLWSCWCSLRCKSSLKAVISAAVMVCIGWISTAVGTVLVLERLMGRSGNQDHFVWYVLAANGLLVLFLAGAIWRSSSTWLRGIHETTAVGEKSRLKLSASESVANERVVAAYSFKSLMWQGFRSNRVSLIGLASGLLVFGLPCLWFWIVVPYSIDVGFLYNFMLFVAVFFGSLTGLAIFRGDQANKSFLFFQQQADFPRKVWLSRMVLFVTLLPFVICTLIWVIGASNSPGRIEYSSGLPVSMRYLYQNVTVWNGLLVFLTAFSVMQLVSIVVRSGIIAFFSSGILAFVVAAWCRMILKTDESLFVFAAPLIISCLVASWWYAPRWISERKPIRSKVLLFVVATSVFVACTAGYVLQRVNIGVAGISSEYQTAFESHDNFLNSDKERFKSVFLMKEAVTALDDTQLRKEQAKLPENDRGHHERWPDQILEDHVSLNQEVLAKVEEALSDDLIYHWTTPTSENERVSQYVTIANLLSIQSEHLKRETDVERLRDSLAAEVRAAWRLNPRPALKSARDVMKFCQWSEMEGQTEESLRTGIAKLKRLRFEILNPDSKRIQHEIYFNIQREFSLSSNGQSFLAGVLLQRASYWENVRRHRMALSDFTRLDETVRQKLSVPLDFWHQQWTHAPSLRNIMNEHDYPDQNRSEILALDQALNYATIRVALQVYRLEHGKYPQSLDELTLNGEKGAILDDVPNISSGIVQIAFAYFPDGLERAAFLPSMTTYNENGWQDLFDVTQSIPPGTPFLLPFAGNFKLGPVLTGASSSNAAKFSRAYSFVDPGRNGPDVKFFSYQYVPKRDYVLPAVKTDGQDN